MREVGGMAAWGYVYNNEKNDFLSKNHKQSKAFIFIHRGVCEVKYYVCVGWVVGRCVGTR